MKYVMAFESLLLEPFSIEISSVRKMCDSGWKQELYARITITKDI